MAIDLVARGLYDPAYPTLVKQIPTILASWWCTGFSLAAILIRLSGRVIRLNRLFSEDKIMAASIIPLLGRMAFVHVVLLYGTNNLGYEGHTDIDPTNFARLELGSKLVLAARICYAMFLWIQKLTILQSFKRLTGQSWNKGYQLGLVVIRWFLVATFLAVCIATIGECHPINHYWQVHPDPGPQCREAYAQLITMGTLNIITDFILVVYPVSIILASHFTLKRKIQLTLLFALSFVPIAITGYRIPKIIEHHGRQQFRSLWASLEILAATGAANAVVIGSFVRDRGPKKMKYKFGSTSGSLERPPTHRRRPSHWGSDEDLFGGTGVGLSPDLRKTQDLEARPAPLAVELDENGHAINPAPQFQIPDDDATSSDTDLKAADPQQSPGQMSVDSAGKTGFFDVGGLLETGPPPRTPEMSEAADHGSSAILSKHRANAAGRRGSEALLHDMGGLLSPLPEAPRRPSLTPIPAPAALPPPIHPVSSPLEKPKTSPGRRRIDSEDTLIEEAPRHSARRDRSVGEQSSRPQPARSATLESLQDVGGLLSSPN